MPDDLPVDGRLKRAPLPQHVEANRVTGRTDAVRVASKEGRQRYADLLARLGDVERTRRRDQSLRSQQE